MNSLWEHLINLIETKFKVRVESKLQPPLLNQLLCAWLLLSESQTLNGEAYKLKSNKLSELNSQLNQAWETIPIHSIKLNQACSHITYTSKTNIEYKNIKQLHPVFHIISQLQILLLRWNTNNWRQQVNLHVIKCLVSSNTNAAKTFF